MGHSTLRIGILSRDGDHMLVRFVMYFCRLEDVKRFLIQTP